jgi:hypothetical protein
LAGRNTVRPSNVPSPIWRNKLERILLTVLDLGCHNLLI